MAPVMPMRQGLFVSPIPTIIPRRGIQDVDHRVLDSYVVDGPEVGPGLLRQLTFLRHGCYFRYDFCVKSNFNHDFRDKAGVQERGLL